MGHDLGHTPFGHAGEFILDEILKGYGQTFNHSDQSVRVVTKIENLNLTYEVIEGIKLHTHTGPWSESLEGQVVRMADRIAYIRHDIEDALRARVLRKSDLPSKHTKVLGSHILDTIIFDIVKTSLGKSRVQTSKKVGQAVQGMYDFLYKKVYTNPVAKSEEIKIPAMLRLLFRYFLYNPNEMAGYKKKMKKTEVLQLTTDFVAGMTDRFATQKFSELFIPEEWHK